MTKEKTKPFLRVKSPSCRSQSLFWPPEKADGCNQICRNRSSAWPSAVARTRLGNRHRPASAPHCSRFPPDNAPLRAVAESFSAIVVEQPQPQGTADAAKRALQKLPENGWAIILCADTPLLRTATIRRLAKTERRNLSLLSFYRHRPDRLWSHHPPRRENCRIVEEKDADAHTRKLNEVYAGALGAPVNWLKKTLPQLNAKNAAKEFYLTDLVAAAVKAGRSVAAVRAAEEEARGINTPAELAAAAPVCAVVTPILYWRAAFV